MPLAEQAKGLDTPCNMRTILRAIAELHRVSTFAIAACNIARNVAGVEASSSTSATFHATIALCLPPATLHVMV